MFSINLAFEIVTRVQFWARKLHIQPRSLVGAGHARDLLKSSRFLIDDDDVFMLINI